MFRRILFLVIKSAQFISFQKPQSTAQRHIHGVDDMVIDWPVDLGVTIQRIDKDVKDTIGMDTDDAIMTDVSTLHQLNIILAHLWKKKFTFRSHRFSFGVDHYFKIFRFINNQYQFHL